MSRLDTNQIWLALGDFYDLFPSEERVYWSTFWEAYSDLVADLWGLAFQVDRAKSLFATTPTFERRAVLLKFSNLVKGLEAQFRISRIEESGGLTILRGFVPRDLRTFTAQQLPRRGLIRVGVDQIAYTQVNTVSESSGYVREATFVLAEAPAHDYADDPEFNDSFPVQSLSMRARVGHAAGATVIDAVVDGTPPDVNSSGLLAFGVQGVNYELLAYESVTVIGSRYLFQLASGYQAPATAPPDLDHSHPVDDPLTVYFHDTSRWSQKLVGRGRVEAQGAVSLFVDNLPGPFVASRASVVGGYRLQSNVDFDVSVAMDARVWEDPAVAPSSKQAVARINIGGGKYVLGIRVRDTGTGPEHSIVHGVEGLESTTALDSAPTTFEVRFKRLGNDLEFLYRPLSETDFQLVNKVTVPGGIATLDFDLLDTDSESASQVVYDEVIRRAGDIVGNQRLEEFFLATDTYPYVYDIDQLVTEAAELMDRPRSRSESLRTVAEIVDDDPGTIRAVGHGDDFEPLGVPGSGLLEIDGTQIVYDKVTRDGDVFEFEIRGKLDPDIVPVSAGEDITVSTTHLLSAADYRLPGDGTIELRNLPTRDRMWAPVAQVDERHVQEHYGQLVDLDSEISTQTYLNRVQGTWYALMDGPFYRNMHSGVQLSMGLPVAKISGTVTSLRDDYDALGRLVRRTLSILGNGRVVEHELAASLYPYIDWSVVVGQRVDQFQPLTNGVEVWDVRSDELWHKRFPGVAEIERFNTFGVFVAIEALNPEADYLDALRFATRIKPTYSKLVMRFLLTSGNEDLSTELEDDVSAIELPHLCEDMTLPEGDPPADILQILRLGEGHKLGQGKVLGGSWQWHYQTLGTYTREGPYTDDGQVAAGGSIFSSAGAHNFVATDLGKTVHIKYSPDSGGDHKIAEVLSSTSVRVIATFPADESALDWELRDYLQLGDGETLGTISAYKCEPPAEHEPDEVVFSEQIVTVAVSP